jgi:translocation and assembly module TamB
MSRRKRRVLIAAGSVTLLVALVAVAGILTLRSRWFYEQVRQRVVSTVETATGGRVEAGSFQFDWTRLRAEIRRFTLHGTEPEGKPPLFRAGSIAVGLKIVSVWKQAVDIQYLEVGEPRVYLIVDPDGRTNVPEPKIKRRVQRNAAETILDLAIGRFDLRNGVFEVEKRGKTPLDAHGRNLNARFAYEPAGPRYRGNLSIEPLDCNLPGVAPLALRVNLGLAVEKNRIEITSGSLATGDSRLEFSGAVDDLNSPQGSFAYLARLSLGDVSRIARVSELRKGAAEVGGNATWSGGGRFAATGNLRAYGVDYRDSTVTLRDCRLDGALTATPDEIDITGARLAGNYVPRNGPVPATGQIAKIALRGRDLNLQDVSLSGLGGTFRGQALLRALRYYTIQGEFTGFQARRVVALYSREPLPWNAQGAGTVAIEGALGRKQDLRVTGRVEVTPAADSEPVHGRISAVYEGQGETIDLGQSTLSLPSSRADFSGVLGRELKVRMETRDLNDLLPVLGGNAESLPIRLEDGSAVLDGLVTGTLDNPQITGRIGVKGFVWSGKRFDSLESAVAASPNSIRFQDAVVRQGSLHADLQAALGPRDWKIGDDSPIAGSGSVRDADAAEMAAFAGASGIPVSGTVAATAQLAGTVGKPILTGDLEVARGSLQGEPFDRFTAHVNYTGQSVQLTSGQIVAGAKDLRLSATYQQAAARFDQGRLHFRISSNGMGLDGIQSLAKLRPGIRGTVGLTGEGDLDLVSRAGSGVDVRIAALQGEIAGKGLRLTGQALGDARLTANSEAGVLRVRLTSDFAGSRIRGDGEWSLAGDYPGSATITISRLDFGQLESWLFPAESAASRRFSGLAEGELRIQGPALKPAGMKAELRIPKLEIAPAQSSNGRGASRAEVLALHNDGPIVVSMANSVITVQNAHLQGRATDLTVSGKASLDSKTPLDLRVNGRIDLGIVQDLDPNLNAAGMVSADATIRGAFDSPQVNGRLQFQRAELNIADFPNGISNATGVILLSPNRATIQTLSGETGGGKIELSGFASYSGDVPLFQLHAEARQVRVRYPEGVSTVANASLSLTGTEARSMLSGTITVVRTGFNPQSDFGSLIARSAEPVRTPAAPTGILGGLNFDVQINTSPDIQFQSSLTQDLQVDANLQLRGNVSNPALIGRITVTQGQLVFYGTKYNINQGSISFYNPLKIDPILDIDLETKARGIDITLTVSGPLNKPKLTPRSDPPLQFQEIVALLATGRTPTSDPTLLAQQSTSPQSWQQMGASALLGQAIANPVAGRLQRFFGVSKLRIDPTLPGVENNPQARLTLEQQVTPDITFTYITNVTTTNPQVVRVEWAVSKRWSVVALRDENGTFGMDFYFKRRF